MRVITLGLSGVVAVALCVVTLQGQQELTPPGAFWSKAKIDAGLQIEPEHIGGGNSVEVYAPGELKMRTRFASKPNNSSIHPNVDEFLLVTDGSGTFMTGGSYNDAENRAGGIHGGEAHDVTAGDFVVIPAGTLHGFTKINGTVTMFEGRYPARIAVRGGQQEMTPPGIYWSKGKIDASLRLEPEHVGGGNSVEFYAPGEVKMRMRSASKPNNKSIHRDVDEFVLFTGGSGTFMTGGTYDDSQNRAGGIHGGEAHDVKPGDFVMIPAGTLHGFTKINDTVTMLEGRYPPAE